MGHWIRREWARNFAGLRMKLIIWDFDGTLADSRPLIVAGMQHTLEQLGKPESLMREWLKYVGLPVEDGIRQTFHPGTDAELEHILQVYRGFGHAEHMHLIQPFAEMTPLLEDLRKRGMPMALATSKRLKPLSGQIRAFGWEGFFDPIVTPDDVTHAKPHPESLFLCLKAHGLAPADVVMVGDTRFDLEMARSAGIPGLAVGHGFHGKDELMKAGPRAYAPDVAALREILFSWIEP